MTNILGLKGRNGFIAGILAAGCLLVPAAHADIVVNGNFDANTPGGGTAPAGWTLTNAASGSDFFVGPGPTYGALSAPNSANFGAVGSTDDVLSQVLTTTPGQSYVLDFFLAHDSTNSENDFSASWNGTAVLSLVNTAAFNYTEYTYDVTATSATTTLSFAGREVPAYYELDNVSVTPSSAVPEPGYIAFLGVGLAGLVARRFRR